MSDFKHHNCPEDDADEDFAVDEMDNDTAHENVLLNIFTSCDVNQTGLVRVSKIIEFITPYMDRNISHLNDLRKALDSEVCDPLINANFFMKTMKEWAEKFKDGLHNDSNDRSRTPVSSAQPSDNIIMHSTPSNENFGKGLRENSESIFRMLDFNLSDADINLSNYSFTGNTTAGGADSAILQEQVNEMQYQNKKLSDMLSDIRVQLNASEEQNSVLQSENEKLGRKLQAEQKMVEVFQREKKEYEEYRENIEKRYESLNQHLHSYRKENSLLKQTVEDLEKENEKLTETVTQLRHRELDDNPKIEELQIAIAIKEKDIVALEEKLKHLKENYTEKENAIQFYIEQTEHLQYENKTLDNRLNELLQRNDAAIARVKENKSRDNIDTPVFPEKNISKSSTDDDDYYWRTVIDSINSPSPHESLQAELYRAVPSTDTLQGCKGQNNCDHYLKLMQSENKLKALKVESAEEIQKKKMEISLLQSYVKKLNEEIGKIMKDIENIRQQHKTTLEKSSQYEKSLNETKNIVQTLEAKLEKLEKVKQAQQAEIEQLQVRNKPSDTNIKEKCREIENLRSKLDDLSKEREELKTMVNNYEEERVRFNEELSKAQQVQENFIVKCKQLNKDVEKLKVKTESLQTEMQEKDNRNKYLEQNTVQLQTELSLAQNENKDIRVKLDENNNQIGTLSEKLEKTKQTVTEKEKELKKMDNLIIAVSALEEKLNKYKMKYKDLQKQMMETSDIKTQCTNLQKDLEEKENFNQKIIEEHALKHAEIKEMKEKYDTLIKQFEEQENNTKKNNEEFQKKYNELQKQSEENINSSAEIHQNYLKVHTQLDESEKLTAKLVDENTKLVHKVDIMSRIHDAEVQQWKKSDEALKEKINGFVQEISTLKSQLQISNLDCKNCNTLLNEITSLKKTLADIKTQADEEDQKMKHKSEKKSTRMEILHYRLDKLDEQLFEEKNRTKSLSNKLSNLQTEKSQLEERMRDLEDGKNKIISQKKDMDIRIVQLEQIILSLEEKNDMYRHHISELNEKITKKMQICTSLNEKMTDMESSFASNESENKRMLSYLDKIKNEITNQRKQLGRHTHHTGNIWKPQIESMCPPSSLLRLMEEGIPESPHYKNRGPLDEEISLLDRQVYVTNVLLKTLAKFKNYQLECTTNEIPPTPISEIDEATLNDEKVSYEGSYRKHNESRDSEDEYNQKSDCSKEESSPTSQRVSLSDHKTIECVPHNLPKEEESCKTSPRQQKTKFTLRPPILVLRTRIQMSPDSPSEMNDISMRTQAKIPSAPKFELNNNILRSLEGRKVGIITVEKQDFEDDDDQKKCLSSESSATSNSGSIESLTQDSGKKDVEEVVKFKPREGRRLSAGASQIDEDEVIKPREFRSLSDGAPQIRRTENGEIKIFSSIPDDENTEILENEARRMLQESTASPTGHGGRQRIANTTNGRDATRRRASIATISRPVDSKLPPGSPHHRALPRRTSAVCTADLSPRLWDSRFRPEWNERLLSPNRSARPSRLELGVDLTKIREGTVESPQSNSYEVPSETDSEENESFATPSTDQPDEDFLEEEEPNEPLTIRRRIAQRFTKISANIEDRWNNLAREGTLHEFCCLGAIVCFSVCVIILGNLILELEYAKRGFAVQKIPWAWSSFEEIIAPFVRIDHVDGPPPA